MSISVSSTSHDSNNEHLHASFLDLFTMQLASNLIPTSDVKHSVVSSPSSFKLYWRSPLLISTDNDDIERVISKTMNEGNMDTPTNALTLFVDITFTFILPNIKLPSTSKSIRPQILMQFGSLSITSESQSLLTPTITKMRGTYMQSAPMKYSHLLTHFEELGVNLEDMNQVYTTNENVPSTHRPNKINNAFPIKLAKLMSSALTSMSPSTYRDISRNFNSQMKKHFILAYPNFGDECAEIPLYIQPECNERYQNASLSGEKEHISPMMLSLLMHNLSKDQSNKSERMKSESMLNSMNMLINWWKYSLKPSVLIEKSSLCNVNSKNTDHEKSNETNGSTMDGKQNILIRNSALCTKFNHASGETNGVQCTQSIVLPISTVKQAPTTIEDTISQQRNTDLSQLKNERKSILNSLSNQNPNKRRVHYYGHALARTKRFVKHPRHTQRGKKMTIGKLLS